MFDELIDGTEKLKKEEKEILRLTRDKKLLEKELKYLKPQYDNAIMQINYLNKINKIFDTLRTNIKMVVNRYKEAETKPQYYDMFYKLNEQIEEEMRLIDEKENISLQI